MRVLVTGGAGFIGSHLVDLLVARGDQVVVLDDLSTGRLENLSQHEETGAVRTVVDTVLSADVLDELIRDSDLVVHLAAAVGVKYVIEHPLQSMRVNIRGTENVLESADRHETRVILFSTSEIYGKAAVVPFKEDSDRVLGSTTVQRWSYSTAKAVDEILALAYHRERDLPVQIVRCFNTCGPRQRGRYGMVVPRFVRAALAGDPISVHGDGQQSRCFGSVFDVVEGVVSLIDCDRAWGQIFNLGNDEEVTILQLAERVKKLTDSDSPIELIPYDQAFSAGFEDMRRRVPSLVKIGEYIGYRPTRSLDDILLGVIESFRGAESVAVL
ncbi:MAG: GDP-mannose 4,6-dehydratase [Gemmatimonadota bacterium]|jgi:UDP-glucose 4-epimerase|nr:GDP-mannose 4,6-dehydratase [Gemmatimonadota bacterium]MDP6803179.1 GDP-mannose 4,6-dehydratase [Gemmatimonadota bacterium]MDP7031283.1 GDP-mannose 4,6-dehydratase [Gemmatimonadota bacterium]